jgi:hypothetical protein
LYRFLCLQAEYSVAGSLIQKRGDVEGHIAGVFLALLTPVHRQPGNPTVGIGHDPAGSR